MSNHFFERDGASQKDRLPVALTDGYFNADEHTMESILAFCAHFADMLNYYNAEDTVDGTWSNLLRSDETVMFSVISQTNMMAVEAEFIQLLAEDIRNTSSLLEQSYQLARRIDRWHTQLSFIQSDHAQRLADELANAVYASLSTHLLDLQQKAKLAGANELLDFSKFSSFWNITERVLDEERINKIGKTNNKTFFKKSFYAFFHLIRHVQEMATILLSQTIETGTHHPHTALLIAFSKLYEQAQTAINSFSGRHAQFYYNDVLKTVRKPGIPDLVHLVAVSGGKNKVFIPKGTGFVAGTDTDNREIVYTSCHPFTVSGVEVAQAFTLNFHKDKYISPGCHFNFVSGVFCRNIDGAIQPLEDMMACETAWPSMGAVSVGQELPGTVSRTAVGFAIASSMFQQKNGKSHITITLQFSEDTFSSLISQLEELAVKATVEYPIFIKRVFQELFQLKTTGPDGWYSVEDFTATLHQSGEREQSISVSYSVDAGITPVSAYDRTVHGYFYTADTPVTIIELDPNSYVFGYSLLKDLQVESVDIQASVSDVRNLQLHNNDGQLDQSGPIYPFGSVPTTNSYVVLGSEELMGKQITGLDLHIEWSGLPKHGFQHHYSDYGKGITNQSFVASVRFLSQGRWIPEDASLCENFELFTSADYSGSVLPHRTVSFARLRNLDTTISPQLQDFGYTYETQSGFIKINLAAPDDAFLHKAYSPLLSETLQWNAVEEHKKALPNEPYTPVIEKISISYTAHEHIDFAESNASSQRSSFWHIHPLGCDQRFPLRNTSTVKLLPQYDQEGALLLGLRGVQAPDQVSFLFCMQKSSVESSKNTPPQVYWSYLAGNQWQNFEESDIAYDSTVGFRRTGIVTLRLPSNISVEHTIMPNGLCWVRASVRSESNELCSILQIKTQAFEAQLSGKRSFEHRAGQKLESWTIRQSQFPVEGLQRVFQPQIPYGGRRGETELQQKVRVCERLSHKQRASDAWDYEHIVLQHFPQILKVRCFESMSSNHITEPGTVLLVAVPHMQDDSDGSLPLLDYQTLNEIQTYVSQFMSPFVSVEVCNPRYEKLQVRCTVQFHQNGNTGQLIGQLNDDICRYLSPWLQMGKEPEFGHSVRGTDVVGYIMQLPYVKNVTNFSMLLKICDEFSNYKLIDTVVMMQEGDVDGAAKSEMNYNKVVLSPTKPWSIIVPAAKHFIETSEKDDQQRPDITGIDELVVENNFIIK